MAIGKISEHTGGAFFKHAEYKTALGFLLEPKKLLVNQPNTLPNGEQSVRDLLIADISVFKDQRSIDAKKPTEVLKGATISAKYLARDGGKLIDAGVEAVAVTIDRISLKNGATPFVWRDAEGVIAEAIEGYYEARESAASEFAGDFD